MSNFNVRGFEWRIHLLFGVNFWIIVISVRYVIFGDMPRATDIYNIEFESFVTGHLV